MKKDMRIEKMPDRLCDDCGKYIAVVSCDGCGKTLCKKCRFLEICPADAGEITVKYFCIQCKQDSLLNPNAHHEKVFGLDKVTDMVNNGRQRDNRFKIKLKI